MSGWILHRHTRRKLKILFDLFWQLVRVKGSALELRILDEEGRENFGGLDSDFGIALGRAKQGENTHHVQSVLQPETDGQD